jgi:predicted homoserine dehydrogenase-like protein
VNFDALFAAHRGRRLRVGLAGAGEFGRSFLFRTGRAQGIDVVAVADRDTARAGAALRHAGLDAVRVTVLDDAAQLAGLKLDIVVEATGDPEAAARIGELAIAGGKHVAMVTKEADCVVGPLLHAKARAAGLVSTPVDGDQPSLLISLVSRARLLGLEVVCAGKSGEFDFVCDPALTGVRGPQGALALHDGRRFWTDPQARAEAIRGWTRATVPDYCELAIVANATGLAPDTPALHAPAARTLELPDLFRPRDDGGLLGAPGAVDMFVCLRRDDELSFAGGVFVVVRCDDRASWQVLREKGIPVSDDGGYALLHNPVHLLGIEAPASLLSALMLQAPAARLEARVDMHGRAGAALAAGSVLEMGERHTIRGLDPLLAKAAPVGADGPLPYYLAAGCRLREALAPGALLTRRMVDPPAGSALWRLRAEQDAMFFAA